MYARKMTTIHVKYLHEHRVPLVLGPLADARAASSPAGLVTLRARAAAASARLSALAASARSALAVLASSNGFWISALVSRRALPSVPLAQTRRFW